MLRNSWYVVLCFALCLVLGRAGPVHAQAKSPEILRQNAANAFLVSPRVKPILPPGQFAAPMPDPDMRPPREPQPHIGIGPVFGRVATSYRGESFTEESTAINPGARDRSIPISGLVMRLQLH